MEKRDKLVTKNGLEIDCNIVGFFEGIHGRQIIVYTTADNEHELLASYFNFDENKYVLEEIQNDEEWNNLEKQIKTIEEEFRNNKKNI